MLLGHHGDAVSHNMACDLVILNKRTLTYEPPRPTQQPPGEVQEFPQDDEVPAEGAPLDEPGTLTPSRFPSSQVNLRSPLQSSLLHKPILPTKAATFIQPVQQTQRQLQFGTNSTPQNPTKQVENMRVGSSFKVLEEEGPNNHQIQAINAWMKTMKHDVATQSKLWITLPRSLMNRLLNHHLAKHPASTGTSSNGEWNPPKLPSTNLAKPSNSCAFCTKFGNDYVTIATVSPCSAAARSRTTLDICSIISAAGCLWAGCHFSNKLMLSSCKGVHLEHFVATLSLLRPIRRALNSNSLDHIFGLEVDAWISFDEFHSSGQIYARLPLDRDQPGWWYIGPTIHSTETVPYSKVQSIRT